MEAVWIYPQCEGICGFRKYLAIRESIDYAATRQIILPRKKIGTYKHKQNNIDRSLSGEKWGHKINGSSLFWANINYLRLKPTC